jgi:hypothetical protein
MAFVLTSKKLFRDVKNEHLSWNWPRPASVRPPGWTGYAQTSHREVGMKSNEGCLAFRRGPVILALHVHIRGHFV